MLTGGSNMANWSKIDAVPDALEELPYVSEVEALIRARPLVALATAFIGALLLARLMITRRKLRQWKKIPSPAQTNKR
jgi:hypothetical protein